VFAVIIIFDLVRAHGAAAPYFIGDWQINYVAGFVRRGLLGEVARLLFVHFAIDTRTTIVAMQVSFYLLFFFASALLFSPVLARHPMFAFAVFSPMAVSFKALDSSMGIAGVNATTGAKEIVLLAMLAVQAALSVRGSVDHAVNNGKLILLSVLWAAIVLVHEGLFFFLPFSIAILVLTAPTPIAPARLALMLLPALLAFAASGMFHGDPSTGAAICSSVGVGAPANCERTGAIAWLARPATTYIMSTYYQIVQPPYILLASVQAAMLGGVGLALTVVDRQVASGFLYILGRRSGLLLAIACIAVPVPAFLASDHGRFLHIWFCSAAIALAAVLQAGRRSTGESSASASTSAAVPPSAGILTRALWVVCFVAFATTWNAWGACCPDRLGFGFFGRIFVLITQYL
jgi:hypothetical protein